MVEIRYGDYNEAADLAGQSVAEARQQFKGELGIPEKATARVNGKKINGKLEGETCLNDDDRLTFARTRGKGVFLVGALLLTMAITGGVFATTATSDTATLGITVAADLATVTKDTGPTWKVFRNYKGTIPNGRLFTIAPDAGFTGDMLASIYITNGDDLARVYKSLVMRIKIFDANGANVTDTEYLTLTGSEITLAFAPTTSPYSVNCTGGYYSNFKWVSVPSIAQASPIIFAEVSQASP